MSAPILFPDRPTFGRTAAPYLARWAAETWQTVPDIRAFPGHLQTAAHPRSAPVVACSSGPVAAAAAVVAVAGSDSFRTDFRTLDRTRQTG